MARRQRPRASVNRGLARQSARINSRRQTRAQAATARGIRGDLRRLGVSAGQVSQRKKRP